MARSESRAASSSSQPSIPLASTCTISARGEVASGTEVGAGGGVGGGSVEASEELEGDLVVGWESGGISVRGGDGGGVGGSMVEASDDARGDVSAMGIGAE